MEELLQTFVEEAGNIYNIKHRAFYFGKGVILFIGKQSFDKVYFSLFDQLIRSATSIGANLVEGIAGASKKDFINYHIIALKSANETKYWLCLLKETILTEKCRLQILLQKQMKFQKL